MLVEDRPGDTHTASSPPVRGRRHAMLRLARRVATESDADSIMTALLEEAERITGATSGFVGRWDEDRQLLVEFISRRQSDAVPRTLALGEGAGGRAAQQRQPVV